MTATESGHILNMHHAEQRRPRARFTASHAAIFGVLSLFSCIAWAGLGLSQGENPPKNADKIASKPAAGNYLVANYFYRRNDMDVAFKHFDVIGDNLAGENAKYRYLIASVLSGNMESALHMVRVNGFGGDTVLPSLIEMASAVKNGRWAKLQEILDRSATGPDGVEGGLVGDYTMAPMVYAWYFAALGNYDMALEKLKGDKSRRFFSPSFLMLQNALMADLTQRTKEAAALYDELAKTPHLPYYYARIIGNFYEKNDSPKKAKALYERYREDNDRPYRFEGAIARIDNGTALQPEDVGGFSQGVGLVLLETARILAAHDMPAEAMLYARLAEYVAPGIPEIYAIMAQYYGANNDTAAMSAMYEKLKDDPDYSIDVGLMNASMLMEKGREQDGRLIFENLLRDYPKYDRVALLYADNLRNNANYAEASKLYELVWDRLQKEEKKPLRRENAGLLFAMAICYERLDDWAKAESFLRLSLSADPKQPDVLNYLAYGWLERNSHVEEARAMIETAIALQEDPAPHVTDSLGWAMYKMKEYDTAAATLESAVSAMPQDSVMNDHLGDVYWKLGRKNEARFQWRRALKYFDKDKTTEITRESLQTKLDDGLATQTD
ncbi:MAG: tetratricopeptide repeat protein [Rickettsiales bacterium]